MASVLLGRHWLEIIFFLLVNDIMQHLLTLSLRAMSHTKDIHCPDPSASIGNRSLTSLLNNILNHQHTMAFCMTQHD